MPFKVGPWELILVLAIILIIFGVGKLPQIGGAIGKGIKEFRKGARGEFDDAETKKEISKSETTTPKEEAPKATKQ